MDIDKLELPGRKTELDEARRVLRKHRNWLHSFRGCNRTGISMTRDKHHFIGVGFETEEARDIAIKEIPSMLEGVPVIIDDVVGIARLFDTDPHRPASGGSSISLHTDTTASGTLGGWVRDRLSGKMCILSCEHVLRVTSNPDAYVIQPAIIDGGSATDDRVARNLRGYRDDWHDCAIAEVISDSQLGEYGLRYDQVMADRHILDLGWYGSGCSIYLHERVVKRGRVSNTTEGEVIWLDRDIPLHGGWLRGAFVVGNIPGVMFSTPGDSGSLVLQRDSKCVRGLLTAGIAVDGYTYETVCQHWSRVASKLELDGAYLGQS